MHYYTFDQNFEQNRVVLEAKFAKAVEQSRIGKKNKQNVPDTIPGAPLNMVAYPIDATIAFVKWTLAEAAVMSLEKQIPAREFCSRTSPLPHCTRQTQQKRALLDGHRHNGYT